MYMSVHNWFGLINMFRGFFKQSVCSWCVTDGKAFNYFFPPRFPSASLCNWCCNMRFKETGTFAQNMEATSSIFSPESWTLLPGRKWQQDPTLKHQTFRSECPYPVCLSCTKGWLHWEQLLWQLPRPGPSTDAVSTLPAPCLWWWQQNQTTKHTQFRCWLGHLTWHLSPARFLLFWSNVDAL